MSSDPSITTPEHLAALAALGWDSSEELPLWAAQLVAADRGADAVLALACLSPSQSEEARELLPAALAELGVAIPSVGDAARRLLANWAEDLLAGKLSTDNVRELVWRLFSTTDYDSAVVEQPLANTVLANDYLDEPDLSEFVRRGAQAQLDLPLDPLPPAPAPSPSIFRRLFRRRTHRDGY